jgi:nucleoside-diphosphate-sugar epimerase
MVKTNNYRKVLVTGTNGFIGRNLCAFLKKKGYFVRGAVRKDVHDASGADEYVQIGDIDQKTDWQQALSGVDTVVHLAARVHIINDTTANPVEAFRKVNVLGTEHLAQAAAEVGVKRFIFVSSVKVNGEGGAGSVGRVLDSSASPQNDNGGKARDDNGEGTSGLVGRALDSSSFDYTQDEALSGVEGASASPQNDNGGKARNDNGGKAQNDRGVYTEEDVPKPEDAYGISKMEAEQVLKRIADKTGLEVVVLRLPLVYGPGVKANFRNLIKIAGLGLPLPLKSINNKRSFLYLGNLMEAMAACIEHPRAAGQTFLVSDGQDISTPGLIKMIANAMGKRVVLFFLPLRFLRMVCKIMGKAKELEKLTGSLRVDNSKIRNLLGWEPAFTMEEGIKETLK